jgi:prepilin-type N-terminal cleavage/methylation domain-containing protein
MNIGLLLNRHSQRGFTLIEVIITLVMMGLLAAMLVTALGTSVSNSNLPVSRLQQTLTLHQTMENIRASFAASDDIANLKTAIGVVGIHHSNAFGDYDLIENGFITFDPPTSYDEAPGIEGDGILKVAIRDEASGLTLTELFVQW